MRRVYVCEEHGDRVEEQRLLDYVDGAVIRPPASSVCCSECDRELRLEAKEE